MPPRHEKEKLNDIQYPLRAGREQNVMTMTKDNEGLELPITDADRKRLGELEKFRLSIKSKPRQSQFRVVALIVLTNLHDGTESILLGANDEPCHIGGSLCAERAALLQLRLLPHTTGDTKVTTVYISSDAKDYITPGMMCREYMMSNIFMDKDTPIVMAGAGLNILKKQKLGTLYPFPSLYYRMTSNEAVEVHKNCHIELPKKDTDDEIVYKAALEAASKDKTDIHPVDFGAAVMFEDGHVETAFQKKAVEYGCTLDAVGQLAQAIVNHSCSKPKLLAQVDAFGIAHAPFAPGRAFLDEHGYGECIVLCHTREEPDAHIVSLKKVDVGHLGPVKPNIWE